jgi:hypothetical protein
MLVGRREGVAQALDRIVGGDFLLRNHAEILDLPGRQRVGVIRTMFDMGAAFDDERLQPFLAQLLGDPAATHARTDDDRVKHPRCSSNRPSRRVGRNLGPRLPLAGNELVAELLRGARFGQVKKGQDQLLELSVDIVAHAELSGIELTHEG